MSRLVASVAALIVASASFSTVRADELSRRHPDAARDKILAALQEGTDLEFAGTPLSDVVDFIKNKHEFEIQLDGKGLADAAVDPSAPVTKSVKGISLRSALRLILDEFDLTYTIQDEVLKITSKEKADQILTTEVYLVSDLLGSGSARRANLAQLSDVIMTTITTDYWEENGGPCTITPFRDTLVISQSFDRHEEIGDLLALLRSALPAGNEANERARVADADQPEPAPMRVVLYNLAHLSTDVARQAIMTLVEPDSWQEQGGRGTAFGVTSFPTHEGEPNSRSRQQTRTVMAVLQTDDIHAQIRDLLRRLDKGPILLGSSGGPMDIPSTSSAR